MILNGEDTMHHVLIIEDNKDVNLMLAEMLTNEGYMVQSVYNGKTGIEEAKTLSYDLILLDIMLPYKSGEAILQEVREISDIPIIIISARQMIKTKIDLLKLGADDYITKPFDLGEVLARIETNLRRTNSPKQETPVLEYNDMIMDIERRCVTIRGQIIELTQKEYMILELLMTHQDKVFTKANLYESIWEDRYLGDDNVIKAHMSHLRNKLKKANPKTQYIETVWGLGYRLYKNRT